MLRPPSVLALPPAQVLNRHATAIVFLVSLLWLGWLAWVRPLALPDEGRYVGVAWEMFRTHDWVTPTLDGLPFFHKPPLFYWITAAAMHAFGPTVWAARAAPMLAGAATTAMVFSTCRLWLDDARASMSALALATMPLFYGGAQFANMDLLVAACIAAAILFGARAAMNFEAGTDRRPDLAVAHVAAALGVLAKGLIGLVLPGLVLLVWLGAVRHWHTLRALFWWPGVAMFAVIVLPWFVAVQWQHPDFVHYFFVVQQFQRFSGSGFNNVEPFWFYVAVLSLFALPWSGWLLANLRRRWTAQSTRPAVLSLMCVWLGAVVVFFSIPQSKPVGYVLPALPPLAVIVALTAMPMMKRSYRARAAWHLCVGLAALLCVGVTLGYATARAKSSQNLALALASVRGLHEGLAFIDEYRYDVPFYLRDSAPVFVVSNWDPQDVRLHDNWRKELADAATFDPVKGEARLLDASGLNAALCAGRVRWVISKLDRAASVPVLKAAPRVFTERDSALWEIDVSDTRIAYLADCKGTPVRHGSVR